MPDYVELTDEFRRAARRAASIIYQYALSQRRNGVLSARLDFDTASFFEHVDQLSVPDVAPVIHGMWVRDHMHRDDVIIRPRYVSSCCGERRIYKTDYCPCCGAKMDLEPPVPPEPEPYGYILISVFDGYGPRTEQFHTYEEARKAMMEELAKNTFFSESDREEHHWSEISTKETEDITGLTPGESIGWTHDGAYHEYKDGRCHSEWAIIAVERWPDDE